MSKSSVPNAAAFGDRVHRGPGALVRLARPIMAAAACVVCAAGLASAQGTSAIAGIVRDSSGGVLPGVTVEASSPALIEKTRTVVSDDQGQYKIVDLPGGAYTVTFTLSGFTTFKREGLELTANFTANVNAEMKVGELQETLTVSGATPTVDVQNASKQRVVSADLLFALPLTKELGGLAKITVGATIAATQQDVGGNMDSISAYTTIHGGHTNDSRTLLDGMQFNGEGNGRGFYFNPAAASEVSSQLGGQTAEFENGGVQSNMIPKDGGNTFSGLASGNYANHVFASNNLTDALKAQGLKAVNTTDNTYDADVALGGPIKKDKLWFFTAHRVFGYTNLFANDFYNLTQNTALSANPIYTPDLSRQAPQHEDNLTDGIRFTYQAAKKDKLNVSWDIQNSTLCGGCSALIAPEAVPIRHYANPNYLLQGKWTHLQSTKLFTELANSTLIFNWPNTRPAGTQNAIQITNGNTGFVFNGASAASLGQRVASESNQRGSVNYVTGSHAMKVGFTTQEAWHYGYYDDGGLAPGLGAGVVAYTFLNGVPASILEYAEPVVHRERLKVNLGLYAQDQWTLKRLTLNYGLRYDYFNAFVPAQNLGAGPFVPARSYAQVSCTPCWKDINPRFAASYDVFGNGKTAVKVNVGRFVQADIYTEATALNPVTRAVLTTTRTWISNTGNFQTPACNLANPAAQNLTAVGGDNCGALANNQFGLNNPNATTYAADTLTGYGARPYNWQFSAAVQQQLRHNVSLDVGYYRTTWGAFTATQNTLVTPANFNSYCVTVPLDPRLPGGGGNQLCNNFDVTPNLFGVNQTLVSQAPAVNSGQIEHYNGVDVVVNWRLQHGINLNGGVNTGRTETNDCSLVQGNPQFSFTGPTLTSYCDLKPPLAAATQVKFSGVVPLPLDFRVAATYQLLPGIPYGANATYTNAIIAPSLGRNLSSGANGTVSIPLIPGDVLYAPRIQQLDFRFSRPIKLAGTSRLEPEFDIYNALNASSVLSANSTFGTATATSATWLAPTQILSARILKFGLQLTF